MCVRILRVVGIAGAWNCALKLCRKKPRRLSGLRGLKNKSFALRRGGFYLRILFVSASRILKFSTWYEGSALNVSFRL